MDSQKVLVRENNTVLIRCPDCTFSKTVPLGKLIPDKHVLRVKCRCRTIFSIRLEFRKHYRKQTRLNGLYRNLTAPEDPGAEQLIAPRSITRYGCGDERESPPSNCTINNVSRGGIAINASSKHGIEAGQKLCVSFVLDNSASSMIEKEVLVRSVNRRSIGCKFCEEDKYSATLGFYLL